MFELKAERILRSIQQEKVLADALKKPPLKIPLTMKGFYVGWGELHHDGSIVAEVDPSAEGAELMKDILAGRANCISIGPNPKGPVIKIEE